MSVFRGLNAWNEGIDGMDVFSEGLEVMVYVLWVGDENIRDVGRTADGIRLDGGRNPIGRRTESDRAAYGIWSGGVRNTMTAVAVLVSGSWKAVLYIYYNV